MDRSWIINEVVVMGAAEVAATWVVGIVLTVKSLPNVNFTHMWIVPNPDRRTDKMWRS